jgi:hypothetical protein
MALTADRVTNVPVPFRQLRMKDAEGALQEGVVGAGDLKVSQRAAGANPSVDVAVGACWVQIDTGTRNGLVHVYNDAVANVAINPSDATNPRVDQIGVQYNDTSIPAGTGGNTPTLRYLPGTTPTAGAQVSNPAAAGYRAGAAATPSDWMRLADFLVPAGTNSPVTTANIVDRRPWARGYYRRLLDNGGDYTGLVSTSFTAVSTTRLRQRVECAGGIVRVTFRCRLDIGSTAGNSMSLVPLVDGAIPTADVGTTGDVGFFGIQAGTGFADGRTWSYDLTLAAGSHLIDVAYKVAGSTPTLTIRASAAEIFQFVVEEIVRQSSDNGLA